MIAKVLNAVANYLRENLPSGFGVDVDLVPKENSTQDRELVITLLRIEEETSRKAQYPYRVGTVADATAENGMRRASYPIQPDVSVNLEILISSHAKRYDTALSQISAVIDLMNSLKMNIRIDKLKEEEDQQLLDEINVSMMTLSLEQTLSLWQTLKGTVVPSVAYKLRMVTVKWEKEQREVAPVRTVEVSPLSTEAAEKDREEFLDSQVR